MLPQDHSRAEVHNLNKICPQCRRAYRREQRKKMNA
jgi:hypothetical protein